LRISARRAAAQDSWSIENAGFAEVARRGGPAAQAVVFNDKITVTAIDCAFVTARHEA
jgi:hypothetical protein